MRHIYLWCTRFTAMLDKAAMLYDSNPLVVIEFTNELEALGKLIFLQKLKLWLCKVWQRPALICL